MRWTLKKKILIGYSIILLFMVGIISLSYLNLKNLGDASDAILRENYKSILAAEHMINSLERQDSGILLFLLGNEDAGLKEYHDNHSRFLQWFGKAKENITIDGERTIISRIDSLYSQFSIYFSKLNRLYQKKPSESKSYYNNKLNPVFLEVRNWCSKLRKINEETMFKASDYASKVSDRATWSLLIAGATTVIFGLIFSLFLSNLLVRPLKDIIEATKKISKGNYDVKIPSRSSDELGQMAEKFNEMVTRIRKYHNLNIGQIMHEKRKVDSLIQNIDDGIMVLDSEFRITDLNPAAREIFNIEGNEVLNNHFLEVINNDKLFGYIKETAETYKPPEIKEGDDILTIKQNEKAFYYKYSISPITVNSKSMLGVVLVLKDVTRLKELDRLKSEFVITASHELRTPMTSIGMNLEMLEESASEKLNKRENELLTSAYNDFKRLSSLVEELLDLSKIEAGKIEINFEKVSVESLLERAKKVFEPQAEKSDIELKFKYGENLPAVKIDPTKITWVISNLISNALRYTDKEGFIKVKAEKTGNNIEISVKDNGKGIPYEYQSKIFDKFVQVKGDEEGGGAGLGLAISREIVHAHGGSIWVESEPGEGSTFTFSVPVST